MVINVKFGTDQLAVTVAVRVPLSPSTMDVLVTEPPAADAGRALPSKLRATAPTTKSSAARVRVA
jgi:hypothetical protein